MDSSTARAVIFWDCDIGAGDLVIEAESTYFEHIVYFVLAEKGELAAKK